MLSASTISAGDGFRGQGHVEFDPDALAWGSSKYGHFRPGEGCHYKGRSEVCATVPRVPQRLHCLLQQQTSSGALQARPSHQVSTTLLEYLDTLIISVDTIQTCPRYCRLVDLLVDVLWQMSDMWVGTVRRGPEGQLPATGQGVLLLPCGIVHSISLRTSRCGCSPLPRLRRAP